MELSGHWALVDLERQLRAEVGGYLVDCDPEDETAPADQPAEDGR